MVSGFGELWAPDVSYKQNSFKGGSIGDDRFI